QHLRSNDFVEVAMDNFCFFPLKYPGKGAIAGNYFLLPVEHDDTERIGVNQRGEMGTALPQLPFYPFEIGHIAQDCQNRWAALKINNRGIAVQGKDCAIA